MNILRAARSALLRLATTPKAYLAYVALGAAAFLLLPLLVPSRNEPVGGYDDGVSGIPVATTTAKAPGGTPKAPNPPTTREQGERQPPAWTGPPPPSHRPGPTGAKSSRTSSPALSPVLPQPPSAPLPSWSGTQQAAR